MTLSHDPHSEDSATARTAPSAATGDALPSRRALREAAAAAAAPAPAFPSRRELREALAREAALEAAAVSQLVAPVAEQQAGAVALVDATPAEVVPAHSAPAASVAFEAAAAQLGEVEPVELEVAASRIPTTFEELFGSGPQDAPTPAPQALHVSRKAVREQHARDARPVRAAVKRKPSRELKALTAAAGSKREQKHPLNVFATMLAVGGMFAVAGLPAYALTPAENLADASKVVTAQSLTVGDEVSTQAAVRDGYRATSPEQLAQAQRDARRAALNAEYAASGARAMGDDYPWPYELSRNQGGGLSPLNYYYRECVDFVAWRLNRDAGSFAPPYKWVWSNLTPTGGNASQWKYAWTSKGWPTSNTPIVGAVAWFNYNHVAYVKAVNADGTVLLEEYNWGSDHKYGQRTIPANQVQLYLYPPPA